MAKSPRSLGYRHPAEWEPHRATWLAWPEKESDWPGKLPAIGWVVLEVVKKLVRHERVRLVVSGARSEAKARDALAKGGVDLSLVDVLRMPTDRFWLRDTAPTFVRGERGVAAVDWRFDGWAKYDDHLRDDALPRRIAKHLGMKRFAPTASVAGETRRVVLEGGSVDFDGEGTMLTTRECLLSESVQVRNPGMSRADLERVFADELGVDRVLWLNRGIAGDDTHGHVDDLARFVAPATVVVASESNRSDENFEPLAENLELLRSMTDAKGRALSVHTLPMPAPIVFDGLRLPASYANFYVANGQVLVPTFNDPNDRVALSTLASLFPDREVVGIHAVDLVWGLGTLHCMSHEEPL